MLINMRNRFIRMLILLLVAAVLAPLAFGWGDDGHMMVNQAAVEKVPADMPAFFKKAQAQIVYLGPEPDRWRAKADPFVKNAQEADHFIDLEPLEGMKLPVGRYEYIRMLYEKRAASANSDAYLPEKVGFQPYITMEVYERLKVAFREYRRLKAAGQSTATAEHDAIFYAGWLGHYVADGANPMHTTIYYNGWFGANPKGYSTERNIHYKFETAFVHDNIREKDFAGLVGAATRVTDPFSGYMAYLYGSHSLVEPLYELDKQKAFDQHGTPEGKKFVAARLAAGAQMLVNLWYTAWLESEKPIDKYVPPPAPAASETKQPKAQPASGAQK